MTKKLETIEVENLTVATPRMYKVKIQGSGGILFNKMKELSQTKAEKKNQEKVDPAELERKEWREKLYFDLSNQIYIPGENIHECMKEGCKYWGQKIAGEGNKTYTDVVASSVVIENLYLGLDKNSELIVPFGKNVNGNPSKGKKSGAKVYKIRPLLMPWGGEFVMHVFDARLTVPVLTTILKYAGTYKGLCDWRPTYGRFELISIKQM